MLKLIDDGMTIDMWISFIAIVIAIFSASAFIIMCGVALMKAVGVF